MDDTMKNETIEKRAKETLLECLREVPFLDIDVQAESGSRNGKADFKLQVKTPSGKSMLLV